MEPGFPSVAYTAAPPPTPFWSPNLSAPYPTNEPWQNFVLNKGEAPEAVTPYLVRMNASFVEFGYPKTSGSALVVAQAFMSDLLLSVVQPLPAHHVSAYDKLSVTVTWGSWLSALLTRGSPYLTFTLRNATPRLSSSHSILSLSPNNDKTEYMVKLSNGQTWVLFLSSPLSLSLSSSSLLASSPFTGTLRAAFLPPSSPNARSILSKYCQLYPTGGDVTVREMKVSYRWKVRQWSGHAGNDNLLMLSLPAHRTALKNSGSDPKAADLVYDTIDGSAVGYVGAKWLLMLSGTNTGWHSANVVTAEADKQVVREAVAKDVAKLAPIIGLLSTYFFGKAAARAARLALIAEELGMSKEVATVGKFLVDNLTPWYNGTVAGNAFVYDSVWGGIISQTSVTDTFGDFGLSVYNDHHFHYGYFLYASAVLAKLNPVWGFQYKKQIYGLVRDFLTVDANDPYFPQLRHFDPYTLHSWASGITEFTDGRNQESTSEAVNAYYAASLVGFVFADLQLASCAATLAAFEAKTSQLLWHVSSNSSLYGSQFTAANRIVGVLWGTKRDPGLWFAPPSDLKKRLGIQVLPLTPYTERLFTDMSYAKELVAWANSATDVDEWNGFLVALQAIYDRKGAIAKIKTLSAFDDGNSLSNMLWWAYTR